MKKHILLVIAIITFVFGLIIFNLGISGSQYLGAIIVFVGICMADLYLDERKNDKKELEE